MLSSAAPGFVTPYYAVAEQMLMAMPTGRRNLGRRHAPDPVLRARSDVSPKRSRRSHIAARIAHPKATRREVDGRAIRQQLLASMGQPHMLPSRSHVFTITPSRPQANDMRGPVCCCCLAVVAVSLVSGAHLPNGAARQLGHKAAARANRLDTLLRKPADVLSSGERKEAEGLRARETYDEASFSPGHAAFKAAHNAMFIALAAYCGEETPRVFYLDGPGGCTTEAIVAAGYDRSHCFTANWHPSTCAALEAPPHSLENVANCRAEVALRTCFASTPFSALYLDGCGGSTTPLVECVEALLGREMERQLPPRIAVGFTLTEAEPTGRSLGVCLHKRACPCAIIAHQ